MAINRFEWGFPTPYQAQLSTDQQMQEYRSPIQYFQNRLYELTAALQTPEVPIAEGIRIKHEEENVDARGFNLEGLEYADALHDPSGVKKQENFTVQPQLERKPPSLKLLKVEVKEEMFEQSNIPQPVNPQTKQQQPNLYAQVTTYARFQGYRELLSPRHQTLLDALRIIPTQSPRAKILDYKRQLMQQMSLSYSEEPYEAQMQISRRRITMCYIQLLRFAFALLTVENSAANKNCISKVNDRLSKKNLYTIATILDIYRSPDSTPLVTLLKESIATEQVLPQLVMAFKFRPSDKLTMLTMMPGFLYVLEHPYKEYRSWDVKVQAQSGDTEHIIQAINQRQIDYREVMRMLKIASGKPRTKEGNKNRNISNRYRTIIYRIIIQLHRDQKIDLAERTKLEGLLKSGGVSSIKGLREVMHSETVRNHLQHDFIDNGRLMIEILRDGSMKCHTKLRMMGLYPAFTRAVADPQEFFNWKK